MERDCLSRLDVVLTYSDDDQDRDEDADMGGEDFCVMGAEKAGYGAALLLGQREPLPYNGKLPTAGTSTVAAHAAGHSCIHWPHEPGLMSVYWLCPTVRLNNGGRYSAPTSHKYHPKTVSMCVVFGSPHGFPHDFSMST